VGEELDLEPQVISDILAKPEKQVTEAAAPIVEQTANTAGTDERVQETERPVDAQQTIPETLAQVQPEESSQTDGQKTASDSQSSLGGSRHQTAEQGQINNLFLENLKTEQFQPEGTQTVSETSGWSQETMDIMNQVLDYMKVTVKADTQNLEMQLHPENLGTLQIHLASKGGTVTANFITQNEAVKSALESQMIQLKENFEEQGIKVNAIEVTVQAHEFERNLEQGQGGNNRQQEPAKRTRLRRINLEEALPAEDIEQEDALTADIMAAAGNTVDYTA
jgi:flagellar hook-length control protein FliK